MNTKVCVQKPVFLGRTIELKGALSGLTQPLITKNLFKMMKNAFYFTLKALFILKIFKKKNDLIRKIRSILKSMTSQLGKQIIATQILHNISRSKGNQTMKCG